MPGTSKFLKPGDNKKTKATQRTTQRMGGRRSQAQGRTFENNVVHFLRAAGFKDVRRVREADGFNRGWDVRVEELPQMVIQCKATKRKSDLMVGLNQARKHNPKALLWVCFHSWRREGKAPKIRVAYSSRREGPASITDPISFLVVLARAQANGGYPNA